MSRSGSANIRQGKQANGQERRKDTSREKGFQPPRLRGSKTPRRFMESWLFVDVIPSHKWRVVDDWRGLWVHSGLGALPLTFTGYRHSDPPESLES
jgi:hypothetical protein